MGPSMSNPETFKMRNKQRHYQEYLRKHQTQKSEQTRIKFRGMSEVATIKNREFSNHNIMKKDVNQNQKQRSSQIPTDLGIQSQKIVNFNKISRDFQNVNDFKDQNSKQKVWIKQNKQKEYLFHTPEQKKSNLNQGVDLNSMSKQSKIKKIVLNDKNYYIDSQKMKNRRLKSKQRYENSIVSMMKNQSILHDFNNKQSKYTNSAANGISELQIQSQVNSNIKATNKLYNYQQRQKFSQRSLQRQQTKKKIRNNKFEDYQMKSTDNENQQNPYCRHPQINLPRQGIEYGNEILRMKSQQHLRRQNKPIKNDNNRLGGQIMLTLSKPILEQYYISKNQINEKKDKGFEYSQKMKQIQRKQYKQITDEYQSTTFLKNVKSVQKISSIQIFQSTAKQTPKQSIKFTKFAKS